MVTDVTETVTEGVLGGAGQLVWLGATEGLVAMCTLHFCGTATSERWGWLSAYLM